QGYPPMDVFYFDEAESLEIEVERNGERLTFKVEKEQGEPLGITVEDFTCIRCKNKCSFCFVDQLPKGLRETLYVKDDDYRLSFISGCYITLTNLSPFEVERIIRLKLSPIYISVHAYDEAVRLRLVKNPNTKEMFDLIRRFSDAGIVMHTQIVCVPEINDGDIMEETIEKLHEIEGVKSLAVVPVGLTKHREGLERLRPFTKEEARETVKRVERLNRKFGGFCYASDEFYLKAGLPLPSYEYYGDFCQIENGVGLIADFKANIEYGLSLITEKKINKKVALFTGFSFAPSLGEIKKEIEQKLSLEIDVIAVENNLFGNTVTVAGLITGGDLVKAINNLNKKYDAYFIPSTMLRELGDMFLDSMTIKDIKKLTGVKLKVLDARGVDTIKVLSEL
ncbi:MAG: DUF512 domain-containing protein, partial [Clostridiales bacterium]|nr:DUF512 domain-containing protein [Clostridiales bacterium]